MAGDNEMVLINWSSHIHGHSLIQTLTHLHLGCNQIKDSGAQHLADVLKNNKVKFIDFLHIFSHIYFFFSFIDTAIFISRGEQHLCWCENSLRETRRSDTV
jgi:hypothetical protein